MQAHLIVAVVGFPNAVADRLGTVSGDGPQCGNDATVTERPLLRLFTRGLSLEERCTGTIGTLQRRAVTIGSQKWIPFGILKVWPVDRTCQLFVFITQFQLGGDLLQPIRYTAFESDFVGLGHAPVVVGRSIARDSSVKVVRSVGGL